MEFAQASPNTHVNKKKKRFHPLVFWILCLLLFQITIDFINYNKKRKKIEWCVKI